MEKLNIPIDKPITRRAKRRVIWIVPIAVVACVLGAFVWSAWNTRDTVSSMAPEGTQYTLRIEATAKNTRTLHTFQGREALNPVLAWTVDDLLAQTDREFALHYDETGLFAVTFRPSNRENLQTLAELYPGTFYEDGGNVTFSTKSSQTNSKRTHWHPFAFLPWIDGQLLVSGETSPVSLTKRGITVHTGTKEVQSPQIAIASESEPFAVFSVSPNASNTSLNGLLGASQLHTALKNELLTHGGRAIFADDQNGTAYAISIPTTRFSTDQLAALSRDIIARQSLTTTALTSDEGEMFEEIRINDEHVNVQILADGAVTNIIARGERDSVVRIAKSETGLVISNREILAEISDFSHSTECLLTAHSFVNIENLTDIFANDLRHTAFFEHALFSPFDLSQISVGRQKTRLCW